MARARLTAWAAPLARARGRAQPARACATAPPHAPVLVQPIVEHFGARRIDVFVDGTVGAGGHAAALLARCDIGTYIGLDKDPAALHIARGALAPFENVTLVRADFRDMAAVLRRCGVAEGRVGGILLDLGVSSMQLDRPERGFSFMRDGPLDMRMSGGVDDGLSAADIVNGWGENELVRIFREYGEEPHARPIAQRVVAARAESYIGTTGRLADVISGGRRMTKRGVHPATLCFQALRIAVNGELDALHAALPAAVQSLERGAGRLAVICFHSLEDRIAKQTFRAMGEQEGGVAVLTKRPIVADAAECGQNVRSRSAKLRVVQRLLAGEAPRTRKVNKYTPDGGRAR